MSSPTAHNDRPLRILLAGGGTGGHVYPAIAIADAIRDVEPDATLLFAGTRDRMEWQAVPRAGYTIHPLSVIALHRELSMRTVRFPFRLAKGMAESWSLVRDFDADVAVGTGGFVSGPVLLAATLQGRRIVIQEQNAYAGLTNKLLGRRAARIHIAFEEARSYFPQGSTTLSGNPVRRELAHANLAEARTHFDVPEGVQVLLIFGGSLGSRAINEAIALHLDALLGNATRHVIWQTGNKYFEEMQSRVPSHPRLRLLEYLECMDLAYAVADLVVCRAGAITCSELMITGTPAILVPSPNVAEDHQTKNARSMNQLGAAELLPEAHLRERLSAVVEALLADEGRRSTMASAARAQARPNAAADIARDVVQLARAGSRTGRGS